MDVNSTSLNELWGQLIIEELVRNDLHFFCLSSGSRSTPLALAVARQENIRTVIHHDERGTAFYALGTVRASGKPAVLICTSGTAAANFMPAVIEASVDHLPLIVLTADRPPELRQSGANQTINQVRLYGDYVRWHFDMPCPDETIPPEFVLTTIDQAAFRANGSSPGPVHINCMYREPLYSKGEKTEFSGYLRNIENWLSNTQPFTSYARPSICAPDSELNEIADCINKTDKGLIVAGKMNHSDSQQLLSLSEQTGWPLFPDVASGLRLGTTGRTVIPYYDLLLSDDELKAQRPQTVLHCGSRPVSKRLLLYLGSIRPENYVRVADHPDRHDPNHQVTRRVEMSVASFCEQLVPLLDKKVESAFTTELSEACDVADRTLTNLLESSDAISEPAVVRAVSKHISQGSALFLASSLPVREMDMFAAADCVRVPVEYNRGASGIDGTIAAAAGYAAAGGHPVTLLIGDLAMLHDLNSLSLLQTSGVPVVIVLLNNDGGGIFSFLPIADEKQSFEKFFGTPHGLKFKSAAEQFDVGYENPSTLSSFVSAYKKACRNKRPTLIEINTNRQQNRRLHQEIYAAVTESLKSK